ncbi:hypothetical protein AVEN_32888-1 [Araneus ventricosus]|uniref:Uncharacterized protein n=1 Tax=Araneus ventricosus TaxID=182803 RepID=A0A4Y2QUN6_ARAVE|nr:hypothetical protein AVEN_32888-1 [Araneus ventricosus]
MFVFACFNDIVPQIITGGEHFVDRRFQRCHINNANWLFWMPNEVFKLIYSAKVLHDGQSVKSGSRRRCNNGAVTGEAHETYDNLKRAAQGWQKPKTT